MALFFLVLKWCYILFIFMCLLDFLYLYILSQIKDDLLPRHTMELSLVFLFLLTNAVLFTIYSMYTWYTFIPPNPYYTSYLSNLEHIFSSTNSTLQLETIKGIFIRERDYLQSPLTPEEIALIRRWYSRCRELDSALKDLDIILYFREKYKL